MSSQETAEEDETVLRLTFSEGIANIFDTLDSPERLDAFILLTNKWSAKRVSEEEGISRSTLQNYVNDFKRLGLFTKDGNQYQLTRKGKTIRYILFALDEVYPVVLGSAVYDEVEATGIEIDEETIERFQEKLIRQSESYDATHPWNDIGTRPFWEALGRYEIVDALKSIRRPIRKFHLEDSDKTVISYGDSPGFSDGAIGEAEEEDEKREQLWLFYERNQLVSVEALVEEEGYWQSGLIDEVDFSEYGDDWDSFFEDFSSDQVKDIFGKRLGKELLRQYSLLQESSSE